MRLGEKLCQRCENRSDGGVASNNDSHRTRLAQGALGHRPDCRKRCFLRESQKPHVAQKIEEVMYGRWAKEQDCIRSLTQHSFVGTHFLLRRVHGSVRGHFRPKCTQAIQLVNNIVASTVTAREQDSLALDLCG